MENSPRHTAWQAGVIATTFILLALPLGLALREIGHQTWAANQARAVVTRYLGDRRASIEHMSAVRAEHRCVIEVVALVPAYINNAWTNLEGRLSARLAAPVSLRVRQTLEANEDGLRNRADIDGLRLNVASLSAETRALRVEMDEIVAERSRVLRKESAAQEQGRGSHSADGLR